MCYCVPHLWNASYCFAVLKQILTLTLTFSNNSNNLVSLWRKLGIGLALLMLGRWFWVGHTALAPKCPFKSVAETQTSTVPEEEMAELLASHVSRVKSLSINCFRNTQINCENLNDFFVSSILYICIAVYKINLEFNFCSYLFSCPWSGGGCSVSSGDSLSGGPPPASAHLCPRGELSVLFCSPHALAIRAPTPAALLLTHHEPGKGRFQTAGLKGRLGLAPVSQVNATFAFGQGSSLSYCDLHTVAKNTLF